jgi:hypothetical protein
MSNERYGPYIGIEKLATRRAAVGPEETPPRSVSSFINLAEYRLAQWHTNPPLQPPREVIDIETNTKRRRCRPATAWIGH